MGSVPDACPWWKDAIVYQVYPASFKDSDGDGVGDLQGLISKLDYLQDLGINTVWLSPMYKSPQIDMGYDISDFEDVHAPFGTMSDMKELISGLHDRGIRLILDLVINHTSDQHAWFKESRSSKTNPKRNWYHWKPPRYDEAGNRQPPNNWRASFGGSVWQWDEATEEYYLHYFCPEQPDLNWENPETRRAIYQSAIKTWLDLGVDGFRVDTVNKYSKPTQYLDAKITDPENRWQYAYPLFCNGPRMHEYLKEMNREALAPYGEIMTVGELPCTPDHSEILRYVSAKEGELNMVFHFDMIYLGMGTVRKYLPQPFTLLEVKDKLSTWQRFVQDKDAWTTVFAENHDSARSISRFASDKPEHRVDSAKLLALMLVTLTGTLFIYQGQEIGMTNVPRDWGIDEYKDIESQNFWKQMVEASGNDPETMREALDGINTLARDHARTPLQWDESEHAGFSTAKPWMRVHDNYPQVNVKQQLSDDQSPLAFWKYLIRFRKAHKQLFTHGDFEEVRRKDEHVFSYLKSAREGEYSGLEAGKRVFKAFIALNFSETPKPLVLPTGVEATQLELAISTSGRIHSSELGSLEGRVYWIL